MSLPPEKASELKQLIHQQLSKVRSSGGPAPEPSRDGGAGAGGRASPRVRCETRGSVEGSVVSVESRCEPEAVRRFPDVQVQVVRGQMFGVTLRQEPHPGCSKKFMEDRALK